MTAQPVHLIVTERLLKEKRTGLVGSAVSSTYEWDHIFGVCLFVV